MPCCAACSCPAIPTCLCPRLPFGWCWHTANRLFPGTLARHSLPTLPTFSMPPLNPTQPTTPHAPAAAHVPSLFGSSEDPGTPVKLVPDADQDSKVHTGVGGWVGGCMLVCWYVN